MKTFLNTISKLFDGVKIPAKPISPLQILIGGNLRSGLSAKRITANAISRFGEINAPTGPMPDGSPNITEGIIQIVVEEVIKDILENGKIQIVIPPSAIQVTGSGGNAGGPIVVQSTNVPIVSGYGIII